MRNPQRRNDAADRHHEDRRCLSLALDLRPKGQDGPQGPIDTDGQARQSRHRPHDRPAVSAGASGQDIVLAGIAAFGKSRAINARVTTSQRGVADADDKLKRLYRQVEDGMTEMDDVLKDRLNTLKADRDRAKAALERAKSLSSRAIRIDPALLEQLGRSKYENITSGSIRSVGPIYVPHRRDRGR
jgi:hypothetical protein